jgi:hypothetical protein
MKLLKVPYKFYDYTYPVPERQAIRADSYEDLINMLNTDLINGKKVYFFCSSINKMRSEIVPTFKEKFEKDFPDKKMLTYNSDTKSSVKDLTNVNKVWSEADLVITTSTITVGCNFDVKDHFDKIYCHVGAESRNFVRDVFQSLYRVRHLKDNELVYCVDPRHRGGNLPTSKDQIEADLKAKIELIENQYQTQTEMGYAQKTPEWLSELIAHNTFEYNVGIMNLEELFQRYMKECNYVHKDIEEDDVLIGVDFEEFTKPLLAYCDIPEMTSSQMKEMRKKRITDSLSEMENAMWEKFWFQMCVLELPTDVEQPLWEIYCNFNKGKFRNMCVEKGLERGSLIIKDLLHCGTYSGLNDGFSLRVEMIQYIKSWLGLVNSQQYGTKLTREKNGRVRKRINGKQVDVTPFVIENEEDEVDVYEYIKPKVVKHKKGYNPEVILSDSTMPLLDL